MKVLLALAVLFAASTAVADPTADYLERRTLAWIKSPPPIANVPCAISCHTTFPFMLAQPGPRNQQILEAFEARVPSMIAKTAVPYYGKPNTARARQSHSTEAILTAIALMRADRAGGDRVRPVTRDAIAHAWSLQRTDGGFDWLDFDIEPWESSDDWGNAMAVLIERDAPSNTHRERLFDFLRKRVTSERLPMRLHDRATLLWTSRDTGLLEPEQAAQIAGDLAATQQPDGGFAMRTLDRGKRRNESDAYATALAVLALCGDPKHAPAVERGQAWLRAHRAADGSYPAYSKQTGTVRASRYATDAATAYAVLALGTCTPRLPSSARALARPAL